MNINELPFHTEFTILSKAWWLDGVLDNPHSGKFEVARVHAVHKTKRYPADHELKYPDHWQGEKHRAFAWNKWQMDEQYTGEKPGYMLGLSADEVFALVSCDDYAALCEPSPSSLLEVTSNPPPVSHSKSPVSWSAYQKAMNDLQAEGVYQESRKTPSFTAGI